MSDNLDGMLLEFEARLCEQQVEDLLRDKGLLDDGTLFILTPNLNQSALDIFTTLHKIATSRFIDLLNDTDAKIVALIGKASENIEKFNKRGFFYKLFNKCASKKS